jgi:hypothetical protein
VTKAWNAATLALEHAKAKGYEDLAMMQIVASTLSEILSGKVAE